MPIARIQMPDGRIGRFEVPEGTRPEEVESFVFNQTKPQNDKPSELMAIPTGINNLLPSVLGLPMDTLTNVANLGIAGAGVIGHKTGLLDAGEMPELLEGQPLGSEWFRRNIDKGLNAISGGGQASAFENPRPDSTIAQMLHTGSGVAAGGMLSPATSVKQAVGNIRNMIPSAIGASVGQQVSDSPIAPMLGAMAPVAAKTGMQAYRDSRPKTVTPVQQQTLNDSMDAGYVVPPSHAKPGIVNNLLEGVAGKISTAQKAAIKNQDITNNLARKSLGLADDVPITKDTLKTIRDEAGVVYEQAKNMGTFTTDKQFKSDLLNASKSGTALAKELPELFDPKIGKLATAFDKPNISAAATVEAIKELRAQANDNFLTNPAMGRAQKNIANALEKLMERNIQGKAGPEFLQKFRDARTRIAKTYTVEKALNDSTGNVSTPKLARELNKGKPLSGELETAARFGSAFPRAAQEVTSSMPGISPLDVAASSMVSASAGNPGFLAMLSGRPLVRSMLLSKWYQNSMRPQAPYTPPDPRTMSTISGLLANEGEF